MSPDAFIAALRSLPDVLLGPERTVPRTPVTKVLPPEHLRLLELADGVSAYGGYFRLLGYTDTLTASLDTWNATETWKFAWGRAVDRYLCFGETAWGDQYAYRVGPQGRLEEPVYFLEGITMKPEVVANSFREALDSEFFRQAKEPYDVALTAARSDLGALRPDQHLVHQPSVLITGDESACQVDVIPAVSAMVLNGDLFVQLAAEEATRTVLDLQPYIDERGRSRLRVRWADA